VLNEFNHLFPGIKQYIDQFPLTETELQRAIRATAALDGREHWLVPQEVGRFLYFVTKITGVKKVYEIGSYLGYSATWFASALPLDGLVILTENNQERYQQALQFLPNSKYADKVIIKFCNALEDLTASQENHDIILIDHDKPHYTNAYQIAKKHLTKNGFIIADNVLWRKRIISGDWKDDPSTQGILNFNKVIMNDTDMESMIIPIGDGVSISIQAQKSGKESE
jgi:predicted O-methyltransferase YrrM